MTTTAVRLRARRLGGAVFSARCALTRLPLARLPSLPRRTLLAGVFMLFFIRALLAGELFPRQSELRYCRLRLALDLASTVPHQ